MPGVDSTTEGDDADGLSKFCRDDLEGPPHSQNLVASRNQYGSRNIIINPYYRDFPKGRYFAETPMWMGNQAAVGARTHVSQQLIIIVHLTVRGV